MIEKFRKLEGWKNKLKSIFWGPSWEPGQCRTGEERLKFEVSILLLIDIRPTHRGDIISFVIVSQALGNTHRLFEN